MKLREGVEEQRERGESELLKKRGQKREGERISKREGEINASDVKLHKVYLRLRESQSSRK